MEKSGNLNTIKMLVYRLLEILFSVNCKQYEIRNVSEHQFQAIYG